MRYRIQKNGLGEYRAEKINNITGQWEPINLILYTNLEAAKEVIRRDDFETVYEE